MNLTDENTTSSQERGAVEETTENDQPTEKASVTGRLTAYFGDLLISAGTHSILEGNWRPWHLIEEPTDESPDCRGCHPAYFAARRLRPE